MTKLTKTQVARLQTIAAYVPTDKWPHAAFWAKSRTDLSLVERGLVERIDHRARLGGSSAMGGFSATWHLCKLTDAGRAAISRAES